MLGHPPNRNCRRLGCELQGCSDRFVSVTDLEEGGPVVVTESEVLQWRVDDGRLGPLLGVSLIAGLSPRAGRCAATLCR